MLSKSFFFKKINEQTYVIDLKATGHLKKFHKLFLYELVLMFNEDHTRSMFWGEVLITDLSLEYYKQFDVNKGKIATTRVKNLLFTPKKDNFLILKKNPMSIKKNPQFAGLNELFDAMAIYWESQERNNDYIKLFFIRCYPDNITTVEETITNSSINNN